MPSNTVLAGAAGAIGAAVIAFALFVPLDSQEAASPGPTDIPAAGTQAPDPSATVPGALPSSPAMSPSPSMSASPGSSLPTDPMQMINTGLAQYQQSLADGGGAEVTLVAANGSEVTMSLAASGDYRAITNIATAPEWVFSEGRLYARLGEKEIAAQQAGLAAIGKPNATWTDAAVGADQQADLLSAGNLVNVVADIVPHLEEASITQGSNDNIAVEGFVSPAALGDSASRYGMRADADPAGGKAKITFVFTPDGTLSGYQISPPAAGQPVSVVVRGFPTVAVQAPEQAIVVTLEDLARAASAPAAPTVPMDPASPAAPAATVDPAAPAAPAAPAP